jgi:hypothetical protein
MPCVRVCVQPRVCRVPSGQLTSASAAAAVSCAGSISTRSFRLSDLQ